MHSKPCPGVRGLWRIRVAREPPKSDKSKGSHRDSTSDECTRAKKPNNDVTGGEKLLYLSKPSQRLSGLAWLSCWRFLKFREGFSSRGGVGLPNPCPTANHGALRVMGPSNKAPEDPDFSFPVPLSSFQQQMKVKLHTN